MRVLAGWSAAAMVALSAAASAAAGEANTFVEIARDDVGGHYFSQVIYAPTVKALVSWGTRTHSKPIRAHETQHFLVGEDRWVDAWPAGKEQAWAGKYRRWGDWSICATAGRLYERDGVKMPRPNSTFHQCCWDGHNKRIVYYVGSMTFSYEPVKRRWKLIHDRSRKRQPPALLLWGSMCYDPVNRQIVLFGGGGVDAPDGRGHTWVMDVTNDAWRRLELDVEPPARCNSRMVYDSKNRLIVLFGGDGQDRGLADTWVFDVTKQAWQQQAPPVSPHPRSCHAMAYLDKSAVVLMVGGMAVADWRRAKALGRQAWVYDAAGDTWTPVAASVPEFLWGSMESIPGTD
ncbi:MAG: Kelch repeat-containing protein, partial [Planctomycetota bacterium]